ncbi:FMN-dependent NADH-azoreductase [Mucilaginibacter lappiensis]|uniref:FMN-dependent NADH-azoreductase n=1 Tax=Mucilaginibacter lappiensis TaxID=354630 RepID=UPI003D1E2D56
MKKVLHIISSPKVSGSFSNKLAIEIIERLLIANPGSKVITQDLTNPAFPHFEQAHIDGFYKPPELHTDIEKNALIPSNEAIKKIMDADIIVISAPMYSFTIPSTLKAWFDHISRVGVTFRYTDHGPEGLIKNKKVYVAISTGGVYSDGLAKANDFTEPYLRTILNFIGMTDVKFFRAEGMANINLQETGFQKAVDSIDLS